MCLRIILIASYLTSIYGLWEETAVCPTACNCYFEYFFSLPISKFLENPEKNNNGHIFNEVLYEPQPENAIAEQEYLKAAICMLDADSNINKLIGSLATDTQVVTLIQNMGNTSRTIYMNTFDHFDQLLILDIQGITDSELLTVMIDKPLFTLKYLNLQNVRLKGTKKPSTTIPTYKINDNSSLTFIQKRMEAEILPYEKYINSAQKDDIPTFVGYENLFLLRIYNCQLQSLYWDMFDGLQNLKYLLLEKNRLRFIPDFAFYGAQNLKTLSLAYNYLLNIQITDLAGLLELEYLDLSHNNFSQLSELSFPPFPKLKLANFKDNPITIIFPNTFGVMNTTDSIILGGDETTLSLIENSFVGLDRLKKLTLNNLNVMTLKRELLAGMPILKELTITGNITHIQYDAFLEIRHLDKLILSKCNIYNLSVDSFYGLHKLTILDLSHNNLQTLPPAIFDQQTFLKELYLNDNKFRKLPKMLFSNIPLKLLRLSNNPWFCSCQMDHWKPLTVNSVKHKSLMFSGLDSNKCLDCAHTMQNKYIYEKRVAPLCVAPKQFKGRPVFQVMKRLRCYKTKRMFQSKHITEAERHSNKIDNKLTQLNEKLAKANSKPKPKTQTWIDKKIRITAKQNVRQEFNKNRISNEI